MSSGVFLPFLIEIKYLNTLIKSSLVRTGSYIGISKPNFLFILYLPTAPKSYFLVEKNNFSINYYFSFVLSLMIGAGLIFELPVASFLFSSIGLINPQFLKTYRREAIAVTVILSAIITPPDPISLIIMSIPMLILYEISIAVSWFANKLFNN